jgi:hypothetical protein
MTAAVLAVSACTFTRNVETALFDHRTVNLKESAYAAADMLSQQTKVHITPRTPLNIAIPTDIKAPNEITAFGEELAAQLSARFVQLGYNVQTAPMPPDMGYQSPPPAPSGRPLRPAQMGTTPMAAGSSALLGGTYTRTDDRILVNLKVVDSASQQLLAAYDYSLPLSPDMKDMTLTDEERARKEKYPVGTFLGLTDK